MSMYKKDYGQVEVQILVEVQITVLGGSNLSGVFSTKQQRLGRSSPNGNYFSFLFFKQYELHLPDCELGKINKINVVPEGFKVHWTRRKFPLQRRRGAKVCTISEKTFSFINSFEYAGLYR